MKTTIKITAKKTPGWIINASNGDEMPNYVYANKKACIKDIIRLYPKHTWGTKKIKNGIIITVD